LIKITSEEISVFFEDIFTYFIELHPFECRLVFIHGYLEEDQYNQLIHDSHFIVNGSRGEGQCLPLMEFMSSGVPAIAPTNTAMAEYIDESNAFLVESSPELTYWPHDPRQVFRTCWHRINWESLYRAFLDSEEVWRNSPDRYRHMAKSAIRAQQQYCSLGVLQPRLEHILAGLNNEEGQD
jgi:glycosyltransferase involved in cell wall biosynthesis